MSQVLIKNIEFSRTLKLKELVEYHDRQVVSRTIAQLPGANITLFAFDRGEGISAHTAAGDALVQVLEGEARVTIGQETVTVGEGEAVVMPAGVPHALEAGERFKMLLTVLKPA